MTMFSSRNPGTILFSSSFPSPDTPKLNGRFSAVLPSHIKAMGEGGKKIQPIPTALVSWTHGTGGAILARRQMPKKI